MKLLNDQQGYITTVIILIILIPIILLILLTINLSDEKINQTTDTIDSKKISQVHLDFKSDLENTFINSLSSLSYNLTNSQNPIDNSTSFLINDIYLNMNNTKNEYYNKGYQINYQINSIESTDDPFILQLNAIIQTSKIDSYMNIKEDVNITINLSNSQNPIYDPLPGYITKASVDNNLINYKNTLDNISTAYTNSVSNLIITECLYNDYTQHGHNNTTMINCLKNNYYHKSTDGICILCRFENNTNCSHVGLETFILPTQVYENATASIDYLLFNNQENVPIVKLNDSIFLYMDDNYKRIYGL